MDEQLTDRKKRILKAIIKTYMATGEPVGSRSHIRRQEEFLLTRAIVFMWMS